MRKEIMDILACPTCREKLSLKIDEERDGEVITGSLHCQQCNETYPVKNSIANLLPPSLRSI